MFFLLILIVPGNVADEGSPIIEAVSDHGIESLSPVGVADAQGQPFKWYDTTGRRKEIVNRFKWGRLTAPYLQPIVFQQQGKTEYQSAVWDFPSSPPILWGQTYRVKMDKPGVYGYHCHWHPGIDMQGIVVVVPEGETGPEGFTHTNQVQMRYTSVYPRKVWVHVGETVSWSNNDQIIHTVTHRSIMTVGTHHSLPMWVQAKRDFNPSTRRAMGFALLMTALGLLIVMRYW